MVRNTPYFARKSGTGEIVGGLQERLGEGVRTKLNVQFYFERPHFLFLSTATGKPRNISAIFAPSNSFFLFLQKKVVGAPEPFLLVQIVVLMIDRIKLNSVWTVVVGQPKTVV